MIDVKLSSKYSNVLRNLPNLKDMVLHYFKLKSFELSGSVCVRVMIYLRMNWSLQKIIKSQGLQTLCKKSFAENTGHYLHTFITYIWINILLNRFETFPLFLVAFSCLWVGTPTVCADSLITTFQNYLQNITRIFFGTFS